MNKKITFPELAALLALRSSLDLKECEVYLREFISLVSKTLAMGEQVRIKGLGSFRLISVEPRRSVNVATGGEMEIPGHFRVSFVPSAELAEEVNAPFSAFEAIEVPDDFEAEDIVERDQLENETEDQIGEIPVSKAQQAIEDSDFIFEEDTDPADTYPVATDSLEADPTQTHASDTLLSDINPSEQPPTPYTPSLENPSSLESSVPPVLSPSADSVESPSADPAFAPADFDRPASLPLPRHRFLKGFLWGMAAGIVTCIIGAWLCLWVVERQINQVGDNVGHIPAHIPVQSVDSIPVSTVAHTIDHKDASVEKMKEADEPTEIEVPTQPTVAEKKPVYDTITKTRYLTTMAKEHYGNYHLWPYIYEENKSFLGHPDRIRPGTRVKIPSLEKYGVNPKNPQDILRAKRKGVEIYSRYR